MKSKSTIIEEFDDRSIAQKASRLASVRKLFVFLILGLLLMPVVKAQTIMSFESRLHSLDLAGASHLQSIATDLFPTVYLSQGELKTYGAGSPVVAICKGSSVNMLYGNNPELVQVELINITVNSSSELPSSIDLTRMQGFTNLKYLMVVFAYDACGGKTDNCLASKLSGIIQGNSSTVIVLYKLSIPE